MTFDPDLAIARLDELIAAQLDAILSHPELLRLERAWRAAAHLVERLDFRENIRLELVACTREELLVDFDATDDDPSRAALATWLADSADRARAPIAVVLPTFDLEGHREGALLVERCAAVAARFQALFLAGSAFDEGYATAAGHHGRHAALCLPSVMLRAPYLEGGAPIGGALWIGAQILVAEQLAATFAAFRHSALDSFEAVGVLRAELSADTSARLNDAGFVALTRAEPPGHVQAPRLLTLGGELLGEAMLAMRLAHYITVVAATLPPLTRMEMEHELNAWVHPYTARAEVVSPSVRARRPLRDSRLEVEQDTDGARTYVLTTRWHANRHREIVTRGSLPPGPEEVAPPAPEPAAERSTRGAAAGKASLEDLLRPIAGGVGEDISYDELFEEIKFEIEKVQSFTGEIPQWGVVLHNAEDLLTGRSKDLRVACYWAAATAILRDSPSGIRLGVELLDGLCERYWNDMYPPVRRAQARGAILEWWSDQAAVVLNRYSTWQWDPAIGRLDAAFSVLHRRLRTLLPDHYQECKAFAESLHLQRRGAGL